MEEVTDEPLYRDRVCGIDIGKADRGGDDPGAVGRQPRRGGPARPPTRSGWRAASSAAASSPCFAVTPEFRIIRLHTRRRRDLTGERTREKQRAGKLLEGAAIKLSSVLTDLHG